MSRLSTSSEGWRRAAVVAAAGVLAGCVTINIYFPAAAAERAADRIIEEVWQLRDGNPSTRPQQPEPPK